LAARAQKSGRTLPVADGYIAAAAALAGFAVATRDRAPFEAVGLTVIDPWQFN
jgi:predicted nucleic acid-binding protein